MHDHDGQQDLDNQYVKYMREKLGSFSYDYQQFEKSLGICEQRGDIILENGAHYAGKWLKGKEIRQGEGVQVWPDGSIYEGYWAENKANGKGRLIHANGDVYDGHWKDDKAHGRGKYSHFGGVSYLGDWKEDMQHGNGLEIQPDGA